MKRFRRMVVLTGGLASSGEASFLREVGPVWRRLSEEGEVFRLRSDPGALVPEAAWLGLDPAEVQMPVGPLTVAGLRADPPERSVEFRAEWLSVDDEGILEASPPGPSPQEAQAIHAQVARLETPRLRWVPGAERIHGLVWLEGAPDHVTFAPSDAAGRLLAAHLPLGDQDWVLRRWIDDSVNLLNELEVNQRRRDEGKPPLNVVWPWGGGWRQTLPNLMLRRGNPGRVATRSLTTAGLARLVGYRVQDRELLGNGFNWDPRTVARDLASAPDAFVDLDFLDRSRAAGRLDPAARTLHEAVDPLLEGWAVPAENAVVELAILVLSREGDTGLGLFWSSERPGSTSWPFDERVMDDSRVAEHSVWRWVDHWLSG